MATNTRNHYTIWVPYLFLQILTTICKSSPLSTNSEWIIDESTGKRVKFTCVNWSSHLEPMISEGLEKQPLKRIVQKMTATGFNCVRFTWATYMFTRPEYGNLKVSESLDKYKLSATKEGVAKNNPQILNMTVVELHKAVVDELGKGNVMVVRDNHVSLPTS